MMIGKKNLRKGMKMRIFGCFFAVFLALSSLFGILPGTGAEVYAAPEDKSSKTSESSCQDSLGSLGWLVCPTTGKISEAVDFLYDKIEDVLVINPVEAEDGSPVYEIWKYFQGVTNILFILFLLVIVFSQVTGLGINNYGIKKTLPKLIIAAVLVNLSFYICSLAVDVSNIFGSSIRGLLESVESTAGAGIEYNTLGGSSLAEIYTAIASGAALSVGGVLVAFESGAIWMMIPMALGALVSVVIGLVTIAMRQAVVTLLIMVAPLAMVAYILPNTEQWFKKWKQLLFQMLIFYPAFSLLFGASSLAGWAIIVSADNGFGVLIGVAVQIFPLFFSWSLMKMSGTVLGTINSKLNALAGKPLAGVSSWAGSHRDLSKQKHLASPKSFTPSMALQKYLSDRKIAREEETKEHAETVKNRGLAYAARRNYKRGDVEIPSKGGEEAYEEQARNATYQREILRHKNNMNKGMGQLEALKINGTAAQKARLDELDNANVEAFDELKMEQARGEWIDYQNSIGYHNRMKGALGAHFDKVQADGKLLDKYGQPVDTKKYKKYFDNPSSLLATQAADRYEKLSKIMEGDNLSAQYAAASAAHSYDTQAKIVATKTQKLFDLTPPTQNLEYYLNEWTRKNDAATNIDSIVSAMRVINTRGDTDILKRQIDNLLDKDIGGGIQLGSHASQALASFLMFEVKDSDPILRRFGKYINLETANVYNENRRKVLDVTYDEYIKGYHDGEEDLISAENPTGRMYARKDVVKLNEGTSLDNIERTAFSNLDDSLKKAYGFDPKNVNKVWDVEGWLKRREQIQTAFEPAFLSASLKWLSGSEQINSAVKFWTGYDQSLESAWAPEKDKDDKDKKVSKFIGYVRNKEGEIIGEKDYTDDVERYYRRKTNDYFKDQTTGQILGMRTDYRDPAMEHLVATYLKGLKPEDEMSEDEKQLYEERQREYTERMAEIQTRYGDKDADEAKKLRNKDIRDLKMDIAGKQVRKILGETGKLEQIHRTRRSGAANNAKDWFRQWLSLDDEEAMKKEVDKYIKLRKDRKDHEQATNADGELDESTRIYDVATRADFRDQLENTYRENDNATAEEFYGICKELIKEWFGDDLSLIEWKFDKFYEQEKRKGEFMESYRLKSELEDLLQNPDNYPDVQQL